MRFKREPVKKLQLSVFEIFGERRFFLWVGKNASVDILLLAGGECKCSPFIVGGGDASVVLLLLPAEKMQDGEKVIW